jgi:hypothetical protein
MPSPKANAAYSRQNGERNATTVKLSSETARLAKR